VSEGPEQRQKAGETDQAMVPQAQVTVLCAFKQDSVLMDEIAPQ